MRMLLVRLSALGDVITASPVPRVIKQALPEAEIVWAVEERCADAVVGHPWLDEVLVVPASRQWRRWAAGGRMSELAGALGGLCRALRARPFDVVFDLQGLFKSGLLAAVARGRRKYRPDDAGERLPLVFTGVAPRRTRPEHVATMYTGMLETIGLRPRSPADLRLIFPVGEPAREWLGAWLAERELPERGYVALVPGTTRPQKMWPLDHWARLAELIHRRWGWPAVIVGGSGEFELGEAIRRRTATPILNACGTTRLKETGALLERAAATVAVDTGPMHLAVAVGCPTVALFGSTGPRLFADGSPYVCLHREFACWPCHRHPICRRYECLAAIRPGDALRATAGLVER